MVEMEITLHLIVEMEIILHLIADALFFLKIVTGIIVAEVFWQSAMIQYGFYEKFDEKFYIVVKSFFVTFVIILCIIPQLGAGDFGAVFTLLYFAVYIAEKITFEGDL